MSIEELWNFEKIKSQGNRLKEIRSVVETITQEHSNDFGVQVCNNGYPSSFSVETIFDTVLAGNQMSFSLTIDTVNAVKENGQTSSLRIIELVNSSINTDPLYYRFDITTSKTITEIFLGLTNPPTVSDKRTSSAFQAILNNFYENGKNGAVSHISDDWAETNIDSKTILVLLKNANNFRMPSNLKVSLKQLLDKIGVNSGFFLTKGS